MGHEVTGRIHAIFIDGVADLVLDVNSAEECNGFLAELHALATELDLIEYGDKAKYREYIAENYAGRTSAKDLDDVELQRMLIAFRSLARLRRSKQAA